MKWFQNIKNIEELRKEYRVLLKKYHPDNDGGSVEATQEINAEYDALFARLSCENDTGDKEYGYEENEQFKAILCEISRYNIRVEIIGSWIWCFDCYGYKDRLKALGFTWAPKKKAWVWHAEPYQKRHKSEIPLDDIRAKYGSQTMWERNFQTAIGSR